MHKVSIVIPTRNRPHLLKMALFSALRQTYPNLEIIVSDNYCGNEATKEVFDSFESPKLRYVRTEDLLAMPDSWEFALSHASGDYVTVLTDDCYLFLNAIESAMAAVKEFGVEVVSWPDTLIYFAPDWLDRERRNLLYVPKFSGKYYVRPSNVWLRRLYDVKAYCEWAPRSLNSLCSQGVVQSVIAHQKRMFLTPAPDYSSAAAVLYHTKEFVFMDLPVMLEGGFPASIGGAARLNWGNAVKDFYKEFKEDTGFTKLIEPNLPTSVTGTAQCLENVKRQYPSNFPCEINRRSLICGSVHELVLQESNGAEVGPAWQVLQDYLSRQSAELRRAAALQRMLSRTKVLLWKARPIIPFWEKLERLRGFRVFRGDRWGFTNMLECGEVAPKLIERALGIKSPSSSAAARQLGAQKV